MTITSLATFSLIEHFYSFELSLFVTGNHHLRDSLAVVHDKILLRQIDEQHSHLATIVCIDSARRIQYCDTLLQSEATARSNLCLIACWQRDVQSCGYESALQGPKYNRLF